MLKVEWDLGPGATLSTDALRETYRQTAQTPGAVAWKEGDALTALAGAAHRITAEFELPYLAHATMEPLNCVADVRADRCEVWTGTQFQTVDRNVAAQAAGDRPAASEYFTKLVALAKTADSERPELARARAFLAER